MQKNDRENEPVDRVARWGSSVVDAPVVVGAGVGVGVAKGSGWLAVGGVGGVVTGTTCMAEESEARTRGRVTCEIDSDE